MFFQDGPVLSNLYRQDTFLMKEFLKRVPPDLAQIHEKQLEELGRVSATEFPKLQIEADRNPPQLSQFDPWGRRIDEISEARHWSRFRELAVQWRIVGRGYDKELGAHVRTIQTAYMLLFSPTTANYLCPLAMSDAAACVLRKLGSPSLKKRLYERLVSPDAKTAITSGQWMTERRGGSDVSQSETTARLKGIEEDDTQYYLTGVKWFTSSITSEMSLLLARVEGEKSKGLSLFCWERPEKPALSSEHGVRMLRLKDKLGTRALPTAEIELDNAVGTLVGEIGQGVSHISEMLNMTRFYNAVASAASMNYSTLLVSDYAQRRSAFGRKIAEHALMKEVQKELARQSQAATALCFEVASLIGLSETGEASQNQRAKMRAMIPLAKLLLGKAAVAHASETLECFGGAGYIEDTGLPRILRDAQVLPIWEGTTNVLSLDLWRAERKESALSALIEDLIVRSEKLGAREQDGARSLAKWISELKTQDDEQCHSQLRRFAFALGDVLQNVLVAEQRL